MKTNKKELWEKLKQINISYAVPQNSLDLGSSASLLKDIFIVYSS